MDHFKQLVVDNELDPNCLLHLSTDGPNVNLAFQEKLLSEHLRDNLDKLFLNLFTSSLNPVHTTLRQGITSMYFYLDQFLTSFSVKYLTRGLSKSPLFNGHLR